MASVIRKIFQGVITFQIILFIFFLIVNIDNLDSVDFSISITGTTEVVSINFYTVLIILIALFIVIILAGINLFGTGLNEEGTRNVARYVSLIGMITILTIGTSYYVLQFGIIGVIIEMVIAVIYLFYVFESIQASPTMEI